MTRNKYVGLLFLTLVNLAGCAVMLGLVLSERHIHSTIGGQVFLLTTVLNAVTLLIFVRLIRLNRNLPESSRNLWTIIVFVGLAAGQLAYLVRHAGPSVTTEGHTRTMP